MCLAKIPETATSVRLNLSNYTRSRVIPPLFTTFKGFFDNYYTLKTSEIYSDLK